MSGGDFLADDGEFGASVDETRPVVVGVIKFRVRPVEDVVDVYVQQAQHLTHVADDAEDVRAATGDDLAHRGASRLPLVGFQQMHHLVDGAAGVRRLADERVDVGADVGLAVAHVEVQRLVVVGVVEIGVVDLGGFESFAHATHPVLAERVGHGGLGYVEHVGDVGLLGAFLGEFHDLLAAFLTGHTAGIHVT